MVADAAQLTRSRLIASISMDRLCMDHDANENANTVNYIGMRAYWKLGERDGSKARLTGCCGPSEDE